MDDEIFDVLPQHFYYNLLVVEETCNDILSANTNLDFGTQEMVKIMP